MGSIFSIFRSKQTTKQLLSKIHNEIETIEDFKWSADKRQKNYIALLFIVCTLFYIICLLFWYFFYFSKTSDLSLKFLYSLPFIVLPFIYWFLKRTVQWYYRWVIDSKDEKLRELKKQKKKILEKVQETETFKEAKEILEKYDPKALSDLSFKNSINSTPNLTNNRIPEISQTNSQLRYRGIATNQARGQMSFPINRMSTPRLQPNNMRPYLMSGPSMRQTFTPIQTQRLAIMPPNYCPQTVKPILPQERGIMEKLVDYVVGDGPNNRFALICIHCHSHNGMALKEEFEFIAYKCCYCMKFNPPRKMRPLPPRLAPLTQNNRSSLTPVVDEPESDTDSNKGGISSDENSIMKIEEITQFTENESNRTVNKEKESENMSQTHNEESDNDISGNETNEDSHIDNETEQPFDRTENSINKTEEESERVTGSGNEEDITFIDESDPQLSDTNTVLL